MRKHIRECQSICEAAGLTIVSVDSRRRHLHVYCAEGDVVFPKTPSDFLWRHNALNSARRVAFRSQ